METIVSSSSRKFIPCRGISFPVYVSPEKRSSSLTFNAQLYEREIENPRWSTLKNMPRDVTWYASSVDCLDSLSQTRPGQERLRSVSVEMSYHMIVVFYKGLIPQILKRLRALQSLKLIIKKKAWTWASFDPMSTDRGKDIHDFDCEFLDLIKTQLGHIRKITMTTMTKYGKADDAEIGPCPWFLEQLEKRNRAWTPQSSARKSIREDYLRHNNIGPIGSNVSVKFDTVNGKPERVTEKRDRLINPSSHKPRDAFH